MMTLKEQIFLGILAALLFLVVLTALIGFSYRSIDKFISDELIPHMAIARQYEQFISSWLSVSETLEENKAKSFLPFINEEVMNALEKSLSDLEKVTLTKEEKSGFLEIKDLVATYVWQIKDYERYFRRKLQLAQRESAKIEASTKNLSEKVEDLLSNFKSMMEKFNQALHDSTFQLSSETASTLMLKVSRIEKDLIMTQGEIALYLNAKNSYPGGGNSTIERTELAERIQRRLLAVLALIDNSREESKSPIVHRVLQSIGNQIKEFRKAFSELREGLEKPESELLEINDQLQILEDSLDSTLRNGIRKADIQAKTYWNRIIERSQELLKKNWNYFTWSIGFLSFALIVGIIGLLCLPGRIADPLQALNKQIQAFKFGSKFEAPVAGGSKEIEELGMSFSQMSERLKAQAENSAHYLSAIGRLGRAYYELQETPSTLGTSLKSLGLENAVNEILEELMSGIPSIDIAKIMLLKTEGKNDETKGAFFVRLGETKFSDRFRESTEFREYIQSVQVNPQDPSGDFQEKSIPFS